MTTPCNHLRDRHLADLASGSPSPELAELRAHAETCAACGELVRRSEAWARALGGLDPAAAPAELDTLVARALTDERRVARAAEAVARLARVATPGALDGGVVCAIHAGHRQDRAAAALVALTRHSAPNELEERLAGASPRRVAPDVLDRLVAEELADPAKSMARRFAGRLPRLRAPAALDRFVEQSLRGRRQETAPRTPARKRRSLRPFAAAAALVALLWIGREAAVDPEPGYAFEVRRAGSFQELGPAARAWVAGVAGGVLDVEPSAGHTGGSEEAVR